MKRNHSYPRSYHWSVVGWHVDEEIPKASAPAWLVVAVSLVAATLIAIAVRL